MYPIARYFEDLSLRFGAGWNRFWFTPADPQVFGVLRLFAGLLALWYLLSFSSDLVTWFGPDGLLPVDTIAELTRQPDGEWNGRASYLYQANTPGLLRTAHVAGMVVLAAFTVGLASRITSVLALAVVLSYVHRAPVVTGQFEPVLTLLLFYLCLAPSGASLSVDNWLKRTGRWPGSTQSASAPVPTVASGVCLRLMQVHIALLYAMMGLTKLGGSDTWWVGEAMWWLIARSDSRLLDLSWLAPNIYLINGWTQGVVILEIAFGLLIWNRVARPILLAASVVHWILIGLVTGLLSFTAAMLVANIAFVAPQPNDRSS
jgi:hypothetical protein